MDTRAQDSGQAAGAVRSQNTLVVENLQKRYGSRTVVKDVSLAVESGEVVGLLGPNGAGKTTCFYMVVGLVPLDAGSILLNGASIAHLPIHRRARMGLSYLPQEASVFRKLTVEENVRAVLELQVDEQKRPLPHGVSVRTVPVASHSKAVAPSTQPSALGVHTTAAQAAELPFTTQRESVAHDSVVCIVPSALQRWTVRLSALHVSASGVQTRSSMGMHAKRSQRNPPSQSRVDSHSRAAQAPVSVRQNSVAAQAESSVQ